MAKLLSVHGLTLAFGGLRALDAVNLDVSDGSIAGLIGPNGAGKTSLLNCISGFYRPQSGLIDFAGVDLRRRPAHALPALGIARTFQQMELFGGMTVLDNAVAGTYARARPSIARDMLAWRGARHAEERARAAALEALELGGLARVAGSPVAALPLGLQKRTALARALAAQPRLLLLDEPAAGLNSTEKGELAALLRRVHGAMGLTILLVEHDMDLVMSLCDTIAVLDFGRNLAAGRPDEIRRDPRVIAAYLGS